MTSLDPAPLDTSPAVEASDTGMEQAPAPEPEPIIIAQKGSLKARFEKANNEFREWLGLPLRVRSLVPKTKKNLAQLRGQLILYRLLLLEFKYYTNNIDAEIWEKYHWIFNEIIRLEKTTAGRLLRFRGLKFLRALYQDWVHILDQQNDLVRLIEAAPESVSFYNKMMINKETHQKLREQDEAFSQKLSRAYSGLESALEYVEKFNRESNISIFGASSLKFEDARTYWDSKLNQIEQMEQRRDPADRIVEELEALKKAMYEAPALAKWIHELEQRFSRLMYDHDLLVSTVGKAVISNDEIMEMRDNLERFIPRMWATGQRDKLDQYVKAVETFLNVYEPEVESEISFAERHQLRKQASRDALATQQGLRQIIDLTKLLVSAMEAREPFMMNHSINVARLSSKIGQQLNWGEEELQHLELSALLHDVGKAWIPEALLNKEEELTDMDKRELRKHAVYASQILESLTSFTEIVPWIYHHHERWDGKGYPDGLMGEDIPVASRIIAVAESYHSMISGMPGRSPMGPDVASQIINAEAGRSFDPFIVDAFKQVIQAENEA